MKKHLAAFAATTMLAGGFTLAAPTITHAAGSDGVSSARAAGCVTQAEFRRVKKRMTVQKVARVFGTNGTRSSIAMGGGYRFEIRSYRTCTPYGSVAIGFSNGKLDSKSAVF